MIGELIKWLKRLTFRLRFLEPFLRRFLSREVRNRSRTRVFNNFSRIRSKAFWELSEPSDSWLRIDRTRSSLDTSEFDVFGLNRCTVPNFASEFSLVLSSLPLREPNNSVWSCWNGDFVIGSAGCCTCVWIRPYWNWGRRLPPERSEPQRPLRISLVGSRTWGAWAGAWVLTIPYTFRSSLGRSRLCFVKDFSELCSKGTSTSEVDENFVRRKAEKI